MQKIDIKVPRKKGPFYIRKLGVAEILEVMQLAAESQQQGDTLLSVAARCLCNGNGDPVYTDTAKMEAELGGATVIEIGFRAQQYNEFKRVATVTQEIEAAKKN